MSPSEGFSEFALSAAEFSGTVRLFPLPDLVLFPHVMQPLHIFEPRYRDLLEDALEDDHLIAMSLLCPGWQSDYEGRPPVCPMACLSRVVSSRRLDDGTYNLLVLGLHRVRLLDELPPRHRYREAHAELRHDCPTTLTPKKQEKLTRRLRESFLDVLSSMPEAREQIGQLVGEDLPLATLTDIAGYVLDLDVAQKHRLLAEANVCRRARMLVEHLARLERAIRIGDCSDFPPRFSEN